MALTINLRMYEDPIANEQNNVYNSSPMFQGQIIIVILKIKCLSG